MKMKKGFANGFFFTKFKGRIIMTMNPENNKSSFDEYDLYKQYWKCRNFELQNLWQRSIFLATFLVLCFTGYGFFFVHAFFEGSMVTVFNNDVNLIPAHIIAVTISLIGMVMSILWACMAKGSKAWYEVYERAIGMLDSHKQFSKFSFLKDCPVGGFSMENLPGYKSKGGTPQFNTELFSLKGGLYSPSKINIVIGPICFLIFCVLFALHLECIFLMFGFSLEEYSVPILFLLVVVVLVYCLQTRLSVQSGVLKIKDPGR